MKMSHTDALKILGLSSQVVFDDIKKAYRRACMTYHPDRNPAGLEMMKLINAAWACLSDFIPGSQKHAFDASNYGEELNAALNAIIDLGLEIEICGSWLWVSGDTRPHREVLKGAGFKWAPKKMMWNFRPAEWKSYSRGKFSMDEIRERHGSVTVKTNQRARIGA
jgi:hypothetical protein